MKGWPDHGYKGQGEPPRAVRADLMRLMHRERIVVTPDISASSICKARLRVNVWRLAPDASPGCVGLP